MNRMKSQTLEIPKTSTLAETYASGNNALSNEEEGLAFEKAVRYMYQQHDSVLFV